MVLAEAVDEGEEKATDAKPESAEELHKELEEAKKYIPFWKSKRGLGKGFFGIGWEGVGDGKRFHA